MAGKSPEECIAEIEANLAALKSSIGAEAAMEEDEPEVAERTVGRGRKKRSAPFFKKKGGEELSSEEGEY